MNNIFFSNNSESRGSSTLAPCQKNNKKFDIKKIKKNTCQSLNEVEYFLNNIHKFVNCIKLYKILK